MQKLFKWLFRLCIVIVIFVCLFLGAWFGSENSQLVNIYIAGYVFEEKSLGPLLLIVLLFGVLLGIFSSSFFVYAKVRKRKKEIKSMSKEINQLRNAYTPE